MRAARKCSLFETDAERAELAASLAEHPWPDLAEYADPTLPWQWWRGVLYIAGFQTKEAAERYGRQHRWIEFG